VHEPEKEARPRLPVSHTAFLTGVWLILTLSLFLGSYATERGTSAVLGFMGAIIACGGIIFTVVAWLSRWVKTEETATVETVHRVTVIAMTVFGSVLVVIGAFLGDGWLIAGMALGIPILTLGLMCAVGMAVIEREQRDGS
jgi:hypothetical protein